MVVFAVTGESRGELVGVELAEGALDVDVTSFPQPRAPKSSVGADIDSDFNRELADF